MPHYPKPFFKKARGLWYVEINRRQINLGPDQEEAFRRYHQLMTEKREVIVGAQSLAAVVDAFLEWCQKNRSPETYEGYRYRLERLVQKYPQLRAAELRPFHVETWADDYDVTVTTRRNYLRAIKRCMRWAVRQGYLAENPIEHLEVPRGEKKEVAIMQAEYDYMLSFVRSDALLDLFTVTWESGCRPQESLIVEARHVELSNQRWVIQRSESKTKRLARVIYLTDRAMEITRRRMFAFPDGPMFRNNRGEPWTTDAVNCAVDAIRVRMGQAEMERRGETISDDDIKAFIPSLKPTETRHGVTQPKSQSRLRSEARRKLLQKRVAELAPRYSLYALRHSWATNALQRGVDPLTVAILMGHEDPSTLSRVYQHVSLNPAHMLEQAKRAAAG